MSEEECVLVPWLLGLLHSKDKEILALRSGSEAREIHLTRGKVAIVDAVDFDRVSAYAWVAAEYPNSWYAQRTERVGGRLVTVRMHRFVLGVHRGRQVDHVNGDGLDNRRANLRVCTAAENARNAKKQRNAGNRFKGVSMDASTGHFRARIMFQGKSHPLGSYASDEEAARAYDEAARRYHGAYARLNFPEVSRAG